MIAVDTNILIRILTKDDPVQSKRAAQLMERNDILIPKTVIMETEWVLRYAYGIDKKTIQQAFRKLLGLPNVHVEDSQALFQAVSWYEEGFDFADALHLASSSRANRFATFDKALVKKASKSTSVEVFKP